MTDQSDYLVGVIIYMPKTMREKLKSIAHKHENNMSEYVRDLLTREFEGGSDD